MRTLRASIGCRLAAALLSAALLPEPAPSGEADADGTAPIFQPLPGARLRLEGVIGPRLEANLDGWLLRAPAANPGMLEMFRLRDRKPSLDLVPWAGEFAGKYLIAAIQALRLTDRPELEKVVRETLAELIASQAEDGYLGPFPERERLKGHWDLWGHYHCMLALLLWHERSGDESALDACRRAADRIAAEYLGTGRRVLDAGSHEMNMAVIHALGRLYRLTREPSYLAMMREIEKDWEKSGDYLRAGLAGLEFFEIPRPRWESLHDLQGLLELYQITGDRRYRDAFEHHWRSIRRRDRRNSGAFSSGEQATGDPWAPTAIETCCTIAWMAMTLDQLRISGDPLAADELELSTYNAACGAQHPSGRWWTYSTPMDGKREASAHTIVFQARAGTPELNCCSVNGPRALGMLADWAVQAAPGALIINYYGAGSFQGRLEDGTPVSIRQWTEYPLSGHVRLEVSPGSPVRFALRLRVPEWSERSAAAVNGAAIDGIRPGSYLEIERTWKDGDAVALDLDLRLRFEPGARDADGKVSLYRGPLLLAWDQRWNDHDEDAIPPLDLSRLGAAALVEDRRPPLSDRERTLEPWLLIDLPAAGGRTIRLCDFAGAGAAGTRYRSWLAAPDCPPPPAAARMPRDGASIPRGAALFRWNGPRRAGRRVADYRLVIAEEAEKSRPLLAIAGIDRSRAVIDAERMRALPEGRWLQWMVIASNPHGATSSGGPPARFRIDPSLPPLEDADLALAAEGPGGIIVEAPLSGGPEPAFGALRMAAGHRPAPGPSGREGGAVAVDGERGMLVYSIDEFPAEDYSAAVRFRVRERPAGRLGQVLSAWAAPMDDPLRITLDGGKLYARIEASGRSFSTEGMAIEAGRWIHAAAVKQGARLTLYIDGRAVGTAAAPASVNSAARDIALGGNPHFGGNEHLDAEFSEFTLRARALAPEEVAALAAGE